MLKSRLGDTRRPLRALWASGRTATILSYGLAGAVLVAGVLFFGREIDRHIGDVEAWVGGLGAWAPIVFALLYAILGSIFVPDVLLGIIAGSVFGFARGLAAVAVGSLAGAILQFVLARHVFKRSVDRFLSSRPSLAAILAAVRRDEWRLQVLIRFTPLNRAVTSYALGAVGVGFARFVGACTALLPSLALEVYVGSAGKHLARIAGQPDQAVVLRDVVLIAGLAVALAAMTIVSRAARRTLEAAAAASGRRA
ncbi:MAG: VTT domain-containing protein [Acidobacteriota bacterium]|nr:VTT domain-containing protein [Acidobacteriota bacterium]